MKKRIFLIILLGLTLTVFSCKNVEEGEIAEGEEIDNIQETIDNMTTNEKIGQLMIFGLDGIEVDSHVEKMIVENHIGGFILFGHNISSENQTLGLLNRLKEINDVNQIPL